MKKIAALAVFLQLVHYSFGQPFVTTDNYKDVNKNYFVTDPSLVATDQMKCLLSTMRISEAIRAFFASAPQLVASQAYFGSGNKVVMYKLGVEGYMSAAAAPYNFADPNNWGHLNVVVVRPNDNVSRPCIMLTNGNGENFRTEWYRSLCIAATLVMRGYVVAIYENAASAQGSNLLNMAVTKFPVDPAAPGLSSLPEDDFLRLAMYGSVQCGTAVLQFLTDPSNNSLAKINTSKIYAVGGSWGAMSSTAFTYADDDAASGTVNFNHSLFSSYNMSNFKRISRWPNSPYRNMVKAVACVGGGISFNDPKMGNLLDAQDHAPVLFMHAIKDPFVHIVTGAPSGAPATNGWLILNNANYSGGPNKPELIQELANKNIFWNKYINCDIYSEHVFASGFGGGATCFDASTVPSFSTLNTFSDNTIVANYNAQTDLVFLAHFKRFVYVGLQVMEMGTFMSDFFVRSTTGSGITSNVTNNVVPKIIRNATPNANCDFFPNYTFPDGRYTACPTCPLPPQQRPAGNDGVSDVTASSIQATDRESAWQVFPNPTTGELNFNGQLKNAINGYQIQVLDINGKTVYRKISKQSVEAGSSVRNSLDMSELPDGAYFLQITADGNVLLTQKIILNK